MPELTSSSTDEELLAAYEDACGYEAAGSTALALQLIQAGKMLLARLPRSAAIDGGLQLTFNPDVIREEVQRARRFVAASRAGGRTRLYDLRDIRE